MSNTELLVEDLTDEVCECGTDQVKHWLVSNSDHTGLSEQQINRLSINYNQSCTRIREGVNDSV